MKKISLIILFFLICSLILCGCSKKNAAPSDQSKIDLQYNPQKYLQLTLYGAHAYYEVEKDGEYTLYSLALSGKEQPEFLTKGRILGRYDSVLLIRGKSRYQVMDLDGKQTWMNLKEIKNETAWLRHNKEILVFSYDESGYYADAIDLETLQARRTTTDVLIEVALLENDTLYYIGTAGDESHLYRANLTEKTAEELCITESGCQIDKAGERILLQKERMDPQIYDLSSGTLERVAEISLQVNEGPVSPKVGEVLNGVAMIPYWNTETRREDFLYYDIAVGTLLNPEEAPVMEENICTIDGGYYVDLSTQTYEIWLELHQGDDAYKVDLSWKLFSISAAAINEYGAAFLSKDDPCIAIVCREAPETIQTVKRDDHPKK